jgi:hypothetical protein
LLPSTIYGVGFEMTKLGYPLLPVIERAELDLFDGLSGSGRASHVTTALGVLIVVWLAFPICFIGLSVFTGRVPGAKHSTVATVLPASSVPAGSVSGQHDQAGPGTLEMNRSDPTTRSTDSAPVAEPPATPSVSTCQSTLQPSETPSAVQSEAEELRRPSEAERARLKRIHQSLPISTGARRYGKEHHKSKIAHDQRVMKFAADGTTNGK